MNYAFAKLFPLLVFQGFFLGLSAQDAVRPLKTIDEVINGIDSLLEDIDRTSIDQNSIDKSTPPDSFLPRTFNPSSSSDQNGGSFRLQNELMPKNLRVGEPEGVSGASSLEANLDDINPMGNQGNEIRSEAPKPIQYPSDLNLDYKSASLEDLLREVELLELPEFAAPLNIPEAAAVAQPMPVVPSGTSVQKPVEELATTQIVATPLLDPTPVSSQPVDIDEYTVLGEQIDQELKEKIREAIMETRLASSGSNNPYVTRSVFKATAYCNRVLGRLNAPYHKRYRRDVLLSLINMHERNQAWVDAAKSYERFLEEFAADEGYPFEDHEDAPGIPDLRAGLGSVDKLLEGQKRGAPTIPETHIRTGKIYRSLGAHRMALNKFYDAINATLTIPENKAFDLAERSKGNSKCFDNGS